MSGYRPEGGRRSPEPERYRLAGRGYRDREAGSSDGQRVGGHEPHGYGADGATSRAGRQRAARGGYGGGGVPGDDRWRVGAGGWERERYRGREVDSGGWHVDEVDGAVDRRRGARHAGAARDMTGGVEGNERLTALTGAVLLVLFAAEGVTILAIHQLLTPHFFIGMLLLGPVLLKVGSTGYRFSRYYAGAPEYRRKGPPAPLLRLLGPFVIALSLSVIGTGIMLAVVGPGPSIWLFLHKATFVLWFGAMSIHVLAYVWRLPRLISGDLEVQAARRTAAALAGRRVRLLLLLASLLTGLVLALLIYQRAGAWTGFWGG